MEKNSLLNIEQYLDQEKINTAFLLKEIVDESIHFAAWVDNLPLVTFSPKYVFSREDSTFSSTTIFQNSPNETFYTGLILLDTDQAVDILDNEIHIDILHDKRIITTSIAHHKMVSTPTLNSYTTLNKVVDPAEFDLKTLDYITELLLEDLNEFKRLFSDFDFFSFMKKAPLFQAVEESWESVRPSTMTDVKKLETTDPEKYALIGEAVEKHDFALVEEIMGYPTPSMKEKYADDVYNFIKKIDTTPSKFDYSQTSTKDYYSYPVTRFKVKSEAQHFIKKSGYELINTNNSINKSQFIAKPSPVVISKDNVVVVKDITALLDISENADLRFKSPSRQESVKPALTREQIAMNAAVEKFWTDYNPDQPPLQMTVQKFLCEELGRTYPDRRIDGLAFSIKPEHLR